MKLEPMQMVSLFARPKTESQTDKLHQAILLDIRRVVDDLAAAQSHFKELTDPDLIDAQIYWIKSLESRYAFLIRHAKEYGISCDGNPLKRIN